MYVSRDCFSSCSKHELVTYSQCRSYWDDYRSSTQFEKNNLPVIPSVHEMSSEQRKLFDSLVEEEVKRNGQDNPEQFRKALTDFFDSRTDVNFNRLACRLKVLKPKLSDWL